ncbi:metallophosphoesterase [Cohnella kolymensis]|uniref:Metallophosphoesterase n=1 Tax=Cohnella kolymensis TaxID=1590652 RepID=A0ABR5A7B0_9BACL|nr:metallophosphoesterase family protein [Cohnella kolymensis]KIL36543.1 metallophosphoesterase [Cohnella kolymensis]
MGAALSFNANGSFKIVQFTDLHWCGGNDNDSMTAVLMERVLREESPDLAVITGDLIESEQCVDPQASVRQAVAVIESAGVPWAAVFRNHDTEFGITRKELLESLQGFRYGLTESGPETITGVGNYVLRVAGRDGRTSHALFFIDSGSYAAPETGGYAAIENDQIDWFRRESAALSEQNGGAAVPSLAFFHIPLPEYNDVWDSRFCRGSKYEEICCPRVNTGMFDAMVEAGNVIGVCVGHDHANDFCGELQGITLCYGRKTGYNNYSKEGFANGARVIELQEGRSSFRTWLRLETGDCVFQQPSHDSQGRTLQE